MEDMLNMIDLLAKSINKRVLVDLVKDEEASDHNKNFGAIAELYDILENRGKLKKEYPNL